ncbi:beta-phosphoglucomutase [Nonlabens antarcticus]|uniref:beta-phosphoglucomutase n=1 Tax=Nonlabens antarcticus TaxID=392714 RepID=UPI0018914B5F|nr:beta-phosphoglucomutase [Nonlabens antarcticus]
MIKKAFIFDLDGVVVDTAKFHFVAWQNLASSLDINFTEEENEQLKGVSRVRSLEKILEWGNKKIDKETFEQKLIQKNEEYLKMVETLDQKDILPGVYDFLIHLKKQDQPIALGSASKNARPILKKLGILNMFDAIVDGTDVSKAKPDPEVFLNACKLLNMPSENAIVFEDSIAGIQAANIAGMISIGLGEEKNLSEADEVFRSFLDMPADYQHQLLNKTK